MSRLGPPLLLDLHDHVMLGAGQIDRVHDRCPAVQQPRIALPAAGNSSATFGPFIASILPPLRTSGRHHSTSHGIVATARATATSILSRNSEWPTSSARCSRTVDVRQPQLAPTACRRNAAFFFVASISTTRASGRAIASGIPGTPPPVPTSARRCGSFGRQRQDGQRVADVLHLGHGAVGDAREVHPRVGGQEQVEVAGEAVVLLGCEGRSGTGGEVGPEGVHRPFS